MTIQQAVDLISPAVPHISGRSPSSATSPGQGSPAPQYWADLGCGSGLFTTALAQLLPPGSTIYGVDTHPTIRQQTIPARQQSLPPTQPAPGAPTSIIPIRANFVKDPLELPLLHGILMANSLHYVKDKPALIQKLKTHMHPGSPFLIVEYDTDRPVPIWVPYPISYDSLTHLFKDHTIQKSGERPSAYGRANMYAAVIF